MARCRRVLETHYLQVLRGSAWTIAALIEGAATSTTPAPHPPRAPGAAPTESAAKRHERRAETQLAPEHTAKWRDPESLASRFRNYLSWVIEPSSQMRISPVRSKHAQPNRELFALRA